MQDLEELKTRVENIKLNAVFTSTNVEWQEVLDLIARCEKSEDLNKDLLRMNNDWSARCESAEKDLKSSKREAESLAMSIWESDIPSNRQ